MNPSPGRTGTVAQVDHLGAPARVVDKIRGRNAAMIVSFLDARSLAKLHAVHVASREVESLASASPTSAAADLPQLHPGQASLNSSSCPLPSNSRDAVLRDSRFPGWQVDGTVLSLALPTAKARVVEAVGLTSSSVRKADDESAAVNPLDPFPDVPASASLCLCRGVPGSWFEALDEVESWGAMRLALGPGPGGGGSARRAAAAFPADAAIFGAMASLRELERRAALHTFPYLSLFHRGLASARATAVLMGWRRRLVLWLRDVTTTYGLSAGTFASAIAVSDAFLVARSSSLDSSSVQLAFLAALRASARTAGATPATLGAIRALLPLHTELEFADSERYVVASIVQRGALSLAGRGAGAAAAVGAAETPSRIVPEPPTGSSRSPLGTLNPLLGASSSTTARPATAAAPGPSPAPPSAADAGGLTDSEAVLHSITSTTPLALAGHLITLLPPAWVGRVVQQAVEALFVATIELDIHGFNPGTVAAAIISLSLRGAGFAAEPAATYWLAMAVRALHIDAVSLRACTLLLQRFAASAPAQSATHMSIARAHAPMLLAPPRDRHRVLAALHERSFLDAVALETEMVLGAAEHLELKTRSSGSSAPSFATPHRSSSEERERVARAVALALMSTTVKAAPPGLPGDAGGAKTSPAASDERRSDVSLTVLRSPAVAAAPSQTAVVDARDVFYDAMLSPRKATALKLPQWLEPPALPPPAAASAAACTDSVARQTSSVAPTGVGLTTDADTKTSVSAARAGAALSSSLGGSTETHLRSSPAVARVCMPSCGKRAMCYCLCSSCSCSGLPASPGGALSEPAHPRPTPAPPGPEVV